MDVIVGNNKRKIDISSSKCKRRNTSNENNMNNLYNKSLKIVIAVGGNALQRRGEELSYDNQLKAAMNATPVIKRLAQKHQIILTHGNGPQVGCLALERKSASLDLLGAESQGQIGLIFSHALGTLGQTAVPIITQVRVDSSDPAFNTPTKYVGAVYSEEEANNLVKKYGWSIGIDGKYWRRVVPSPSPLQIMQLDAIRALINTEYSVPPMKIIPIVCGGGGSPVRYDESGALKGVEAVIDKDNCGALLANELDADVFIILTDGGGIYENYGTPEQKEMAEVSVDYLLKTNAGKKFPGSMGPKINAVINFIQRSSRHDIFAAIGDLNDAEDILTNNAGTIIRKHLEGDVIWRECKY